MRPARPRREARGAGAAALLLVAAATTARADDAAAPSPADAPASGAPAASAPLAAPSPADHAPAIAYRGEPVIEFTGLVDAGYRWVSGQSGRYDGDVNLDDGLRVFRFSVEGTTVARDGALDTVYLRATGVGDPHRRIEAGARKAGVFDLRVHQSRTEFVHAATYDPHPFDQVRETWGASLRFRPVERVAVFLSTERQTREGDARLAQAYAGEQSLPTDAPIRYERRSHAAGFDGAAGPVRFGFRHAWHAATDTALRTLDRPGTTPADTGEFLTDSDIDGATTSARAGVALFDGLVDLEAVGALTSSATDSGITGTEVVTEPGLDGLLGTPDDRRSSSETDSTSSARLRGRDLRVDATFRPHADWEVFARFQRRTDQERSKLLHGLRTQVPPFDDPSLPFSRFRQDFTAHGELTRRGAEVAWRASEEVRLRAGVESVRERVGQGGDFRDEINPKTTVTTLGAHWEPSDLFRGSVLARHASSGGTETPLATDTGRSLAFRGRSRLPGGWHASGHVRLRERTEDGFDSRVRADAHGFAAGHAGDAGGFEFSATRHRFSVASDTAFIQDLLLDPTPRARRVRYDETVNVLSLDFSRRLFGPLRLFGAARWTKATGDLPSVTRDASLGVGWRLSETFEVRVEGRAVALDETRRNRDDYAASMLTLAFEWRF